MLTQAQKDAWITKLRDPESKHSHWYRDGRGGYCAIAYGTITMYGEYNFDNLVKLREHVTFKHRITIHAANDYGLSNAADYIEANVPVQKEE